MGVITKVNYPILAEIYSKKGKHAAVNYLKNNGVKAPYRALKRMKEKYMYDEELNKYIVPAEDKPNGRKKAKKSASVKSDSETGFMSMEELCSKKGRIPSKWMLSIFFPFLVSLEKLSKQKCYWINYLNMQALLSLIKTLRFVI